MSRMAHSRRWCGLARGIRSYLEGLAGMSRRFDCADPAQREEGINHAVSAIRMGQLIVLPTDTVYGVGADAFDRNAVTDLLLAKGRGRDMPPPVLVGSVRAGEALIDDLGHYGRD